MKELSILATIEKPALHIIGDDSDEALVQGYARTGNQHLLARLYLRYHAMVYGVCLKYLGDEDGARDAAIAIYEELVGKLRTHQVEQFRGWLYVVARNHCLMVLRKNKQMPLTEMTENHVYSEDYAHLDNILTREKQLNRLENCMEELKDGQKEVIRMFYLEEKSYHEISALTGYDWNRVRSLVQNGRRNLKICMEKNEA